MPERGVSEIDRSEAGRSVYFLRTVPPVQHTDMSLRDRLDATVHNTGNYFFEEAVSRHLAGHETVHSLADVPEGAGMLVLSMSNFLSPFTDLGWFAEGIEAKRVERIVMIGAGAQADSYAHPVELSAGTRRFIDLLAERSTSIGVRGEFTAQALDRLGVSNVDVIGCPSIFMWNDRRFVVQRPPVEGRRIRAAVHFTPQGYHRDAIAHLLSFAVGHADCYVAQSETELLFDDESRAALTFFLGYYNDGTYTADELGAWLREHVRWFFDVESWVAGMRPYDFSLGSRFHGNMAAILAGVPALNLVFDSRTRELCEHMALPYRFLKDFDGSATMEALYEAADYTVFNSVFARRYDEYRCFLEKNGLLHTLEGAHETFDDAGGAVRLASIASLLRAGVRSGLRAEHLAAELLRRMEVDRSAQAMKLAEAGRYDVRHTSGD
jgi:hypothetical protein